MVNGGRCIRAFRPSYFAAAEDYDEDTLRAKEVNVELYAERVQAGLPLFDSASSQIAPEPDPRSEKAPA